MFRNRTVAACLAVAALSVPLAGCGKKAPPPVAAKPAPKGPPPAQGVMVYTSQGKLWRMAHGAAPEALTDRPVWFPAINPETTQAAYWEDEGGEMALVVMNLISRSTTLIGRWRTLGPAGRSMNLRNAPCWIPGRDALMFADGRQIWQVEADGSNLQTIHEPETGETYSVAVSPDGTKVAYVSVTEKDQNLWVFSLSSRQATALTEYTNRDGQVGSPAWSPTNKSIVYSLYKAEETNLWRISPDGGSPTQLTREGRAATPAWAPSGAKLVVGSAAVDAMVWQLHLINAEDGKYLEQLTSSPGGAYSPSIAGSW